MAPDTDTDAPWYNKPVAPTNYATLRQQQKDYGPRVEQIFREQGSTNKAHAARILVAWDYLYNATRDKPNLPWSDTLRNQAGINNDLLATLMAAPPGGSADPYTGLSPNQHPLAPVPREYLQDLAIGAMADQGDKDALRWIDLGAERQTEALNSSTISEKYLVIDREYEKARRQLLAKVPPKLLAQMGTLYSEVPQDPRARAARRGTNSGDETPAKPAQKGADPKGGSTAPTGKGTAKVQTPTGPIELTPEIAVQLVDFVEQNWAAPDIDIYRALNPTLLQLPSQKGTEYWGLLNVLPNDLRTGAAFQRQLPYMVWYSDRSAAEQAEALPISGRRGQDILVHAELDVRVDIAAELAKGTKVSKALKPLDYMRPKGAVIGRPVGRVLNMAQIITLDGRNVRN